LAVVAPVLSAGLLPRNQKESGVLKTRLFLSDTN
jgi:hypothetical protein